MMTIVIEQYNTETGEWDVISRFNPGDTIEYQICSSLRIRNIPTTCKTCKHFNWKLSGDKNWGECQNVRNIEATRISLKLVDLDKIALAEVRNYARFNFDEDKFCCDMYQAQPPTDRKGKIEDEQLCERCGVYRRYQYPKTGEIFKLCANCSLIKLYNAENS
jgi:hypothetical protein